MKEKTLNEEIELDEIEKETLVIQKKLIGNPDAKIWAEEFVKAVNLMPTIATDEGTMIGWFANAIMAGYDYAKKQTQAKPSEKSFNKGYEVNQK